MDGKRRGLGLLMVLLWVASTGGVRADGAQQPSLDEIRNRLRAEAGVSEVPAQNADLPMVPLTVLPGDTHARLATELTGSRDAERVLRKIEPRLRSGHRIYVPRALLSPRLADARLEPVALGGPYPTLWRLTKLATVTDGPGLSASVRNLQRLNFITDPSRMTRGAKVLVPRSLLNASTPSSAPRMRIRTEYRVSELKGLERVVRPQHFRASLAKTLRKRGLWERQLGVREVDLVVIHTTEHRGAPFKNVARYLQRKRLANYLVGLDGAVYQIVPETHRAFGCGESLWEGRYSVDHGAINIEIFADTAPGRHRRGISTAQYAGLKKLLTHIRSRRPAIHDGRIITHRMVAFSYTYGTRSRKGDPYEFEWTWAGLPDNSQFIDQDVLLGRAKLCTDRRYADRVTKGQTAAARMLHAL